LRTKLKFLVAEQVQPGGNEIVTTKWLLKYIQFATSISHDV
jgi:hypothetical protein